jgi:hypothetical protein
MGAFYYLEMTNYLLHNSVPVKLKFILIVFYKAVFIEF